MFKGKDSETNHLVSEKTLRHHHWKCLQFPSYYIHIYCYIQSGLFPVYQQISELNEL